MEVGSSQAGHVRSEEGHVARLVARVAQRRARGYKPGRGVCVPSVWNVGNCTVGHCNKSVLAYEYSHNPLSTSIYSDSRLYPVKIGFH